MTFLEENKGKKDLRSEADILLQELHKLKEKNFTDNSKTTLCKWFGDSSATFFAKDFYDFLLKESDTLYSKIQLGINPYFGHLRLTEISGSLESNKKKKKRSSLLECFTFQVNGDKTTPPININGSDIKIDVLMKEFMPLDESYKIGANFNVDFICLFDVSKKGKIRNAILQLERVGNSLFFGISNYLSVEIMVKIVCRLGFSVDKKPTDIFNDDTIACC